MFARARQWDKVLSDVRRPWYCYHGLVMPDGSVEDVRVSGRDGDSALPVDRGGGCVHDGLARGSFHGVSLLL